MIETLIKLFAINIVASKSFGLSNKANVVLAYLAGSFSRVSISPGFKEKKATSDPEIRADKLINSNKITIEIVIGKMSKPTGALAKKRVSTFKLIN